MKRLVLAAVAAGFMTAAAPAAKSQEMLGEDQFFDYVTAAYAYQRCSDIVFTQEEWTLVMNRIISVTGLGVGTNRLSVMNSARTEVAQRVAGGGCNAPEIAAALDTFETELAPALAAG
jgi:hypothetical protein